MSKDKPALDRAYDLTVPAQDWMINRLASVEQRIDGILALVITVTIALPIATGALKKSAFKPEGTWENLFGIAALILAVITVALGAYTRQMGEVWYTDPSTFDDKMLAQDEDAFKLEVLEDSGEMVKHNSDLVRKRSNYANRVLWLFGVAISTGLVWSYLTLS